MSKQRDFSVLWNDRHPYGPYISPTVIGAAVLLLIGGVVILALPEGSSQQPTQVSAAATNAPDTALDESLCAKQAWPYIDQRCAQRVEAARGSRQVRIVTDKGTSVNVVTPEPILEAKPKPAPAAPVVAQNDRPIGPTAAPSAPAGEPAPQNEKVAAAPQPQSAPVQNRAPAPAEQNRAQQVTSAPAQAAPAPAPKVEMVAAPAAPEAIPEATNALATEPAAPPKTVSVVGSAISIGPSQASAEPVAPGVEAVNEARPKKSKSARAAEQAEKREARRQKALEGRQRALEESEIRGGRGVPEDVVASVKAAPGEGRSTRRARNAGIPDEVIAAVEEAAARDRGGRRGGQTVTIGSANGGQRIYLVPREQISRW